MTDEKISSERKIVLKKREKTAPAMFPQGCELGVSQIKPKSMVLKFCASAKIITEYEM